MRRIPFQTVKEMTIGGGQKAPEVVGEPLINWAPIVFAVVVVLLVGASFFMVKKWIKR